MHRTMPSPRLTAATILTALALAACGGDSASTQPPGDASSAPTTDPTEASGSETAFNDADVTFLQGMVPHHAQATDMSEMVPERTDDPEVNDLAERIISAQTEEIETMNGLLEQAGEEPVDPAGGMGGMDMGSMEMSGMMTDEQMTELEGLEGEPFVQQWTQMMTEHHRGAIESAQTVLADGENPEVGALAEEIIAAQEAEIEEMEQIAA